MATKTFKVVDIQNSDEVDLPWDIDASRGKIIEDNIYDHTRWSVVHELIFELDGVTYRTYYSVGATECQEESPWEYENEISCIEVVAKEVIKTEWVAID